MKEAIGCILISLYWIFVPLILIWTFNTLFVLNIPIDFVHWLAAFLLMGIIQGGVKKE